MKRLLSAILALAMILALVPAVFAAGEIQELEITNTTAFQSPGTGADTLTVDNGTASLTNMQVRRYAVTGANGPLLAFVFTAANTGEYILEFKTDATGIANKATAAAPGVYIVNGRIGSNTAFKGITGNDWVEGTLSQNGLVGYFEFSKLEKADEFVPMTLGTDGELSDEPVKVSLKKGSNYTIALFCDGKSVELNPKTAFDTLTSADYIVNKDGIRTPTNSAIDSKHKQNIYISGVRLTPYVEPVEPEEDKELTNAFDAVEDTTTIKSYDVGTVSAVAYTVGTDAQDSTITVEAKDNEDGTYTLNAPKYNGYNFLYWKKGLTDKKDVITYKPTDFVYAPTAGENNYVIAVYEKIGESTANKAEFYNANGQFIASTNGTFPTEIPSMAGYGDATRWRCYTDGETYGLTGSVTPSGIMLFVADYEDTLDTVKVNGDDVPYSTEVSFTAAPEEGKVFKCWKRTDKDGNEEIVSIEENYKFCAYEDCTIEEVDADSDVVLPANTRKIVLDTFRTGTATALMAEFIGFKNDTVVEKGIMFENNRIAMKSTGTQFTIIPDENGTYKGYAIIETDDGYTLITDGSYTK